MERKDISKLFAKASKKKKLLTEEERIEDGIKNFGRKVVGFFHATKIRTSDELAEFFYGAGIVSSIEEAEKLIPELTKYNHFGGAYGISFVEAKSQSGKQNYKINYGWDGRF